MKKFFLIFLALVITIYVIRSPLMNGSAIKKIALNPADFSSVISHNQMNDFLKVWAEYLKDDVSKIGSRQLSLMVGKASEKFPLKTINWLTARGWDADRFFYVEQRMKAIVKSAFLQDHIKSTIKVLQTQMSGQGVDAVTVERMIDSQKQRINVEKISPEEIEMVTPNLVLISDILDGSKPYQDVK